jgi:Ca2+-binding EF-hand superfamily protein
VNRQWKSHNPDNADTISWDQYKKVSFGFLDGMSEDELKGNDGQTYSEMLRRDKRRWDKADSDGDGSLTKAEFTDFLHPEESPKLQEIVVAETMEDIDKDKDGKVCS